MIRVHGTSVEIDGAGVLLRGPSGAGKSDLALRLIDGGARLVADDQVEIDASGDGLTMSPPASIAGLIEVRGLGLARLDHSPEAPLSLVVDLAPAEAIERLPEAETVTILGHDLPLLTLNPWEVSAAAKVRLAVRLATGNIIVLR